jgi:hypothetical protein
MSTGCCHATILFVSLRILRGSGTIGGQEATDMRHVIGFALAVVLAVAVFFGGAWGYLRLLRVPVVNGATATLPAGGGSLLHSTSVLYAFAAVVGTALLAGLLTAAPRVSPLAAGLPGLALIAWTVLYLVSVRHAVQYIPLKTNAFGAGFEAMLFNGVLAAAGLVMIVPLFIPSRWRGDLDGTVSAAESTLLTSGWNETTPIPESPYGE